LRQHEKVRHTARAVAIPARHAKGLGVAPNAPGLDKERVYKTNGDRIAESASSPHSSDCFSGSISLRRDTKGNLRN